MSSAVDFRERRVPDRQRGEQHVVQFYEDDSFLVEGIARALSPTLSSGDSAVVIATGPHRDALSAELAMRGLDAARLEANGQLILLDAAETLNQLLVEGWPDEARFVQVISNLLDKAEAAATGAGTISAFGEMVSLLWIDGKAEAALRLEQLWNDLQHTRSFSLLCAYKMSGFADKEHARSFFSLCGEHTHVNPAEGYPATGTENQRRRSVAELQQRTLALQHEIQMSQQRILMLQRAASAGTWEMDLEDETVNFSSRAARMLGLHNGRLSLGQTLQLMYVSGDRDSFRLALARARTGRKEFVTEFRANCLGESRVFSIRGKTFYNNGQPLIVGVISDVTP